MAIVAEWMTRGACRSHPEPDLWHPDGEGPAHAEGIAAARVVCIGCPVRVECLDHAVSWPERDGIWGGLTSSERRAGLRVPVAVSDGQGWVPGVGTWRRVRALAVAGWPARELAARLGVDVRSVYGYGALDAAGGHLRVRAGTARAVARVYEVLVDQRGPSRQTAVQARGRGWAGPAEWAGVDLDDPCAVPVVLAGGVTAGAVA